MRMAMTRKPGDLPVAVVFRSAGVRRANGSSRLATFVIAAFDADSHRRAFGLRFGSSPMRRPVPSTKGPVAVRPASYIAAIAAVAAAPAAAQTQTADNPQSYDEIVVVATRTPEPLDQVGNSVTVLDTPAIQASQATEISDLLVQTPGVTQARSGGMGQPSSVFIRGADSDQTLVLIDGVQVSDPSDPAGGFDFAHLLVGDIGRVEILRGPQSTLWGSDAMGGVVNITTIKPTQAFTVDGEGEAGSRGTGYARAGMGGASDRIDWRVAGGYLTTDGISAFDKHFGGIERDGYHNAAASGTLTIRPADGLSFDLREYFYHARTDFDGYPPPNYVFGDTSEYGLTDQLVLYGGVNLDLWDGLLKNRVAFEYNEVQREDYNPILPVAETFYGAGRTRAFEYQGTLAIAPGYQAVFGAESRRSTFSTASPSVYDPDPGPNTGRADIGSLYGQFQASPLAGLTLTAGVRWDQHNVFGSHVTGTAAAAWLLNDRTTVLRASFGQGFKAPSLYQLFSPYGNTALKPETDDAWDAGVEQRLFAGDVSLRATWFSRDTDNVIDFASCANNAAPLCATEPYGFYDNIVRAKAQGVELEADAKLTAALSAAVNYTYTHSYDTAPGGADFGKYLPRRPENAANVSLTYAWPSGLSTTVALRYAGRSFDDEANTIPLSAYTLVDLRAAYTVSEALEIYARVENLFNRYYETAYQYGQLGRGGFVGVRARY
jgi:vitamin B12 transporter